MSKACIAPILSAAHAIVQIAGHLQPGHTPTPCLIPCSHLILQGMPCHLSFISPGRSPATCSPGGRSTNSRPVLTLKLFRRCASIPQVTSPCHHCPASAAWLHMQIAGHMQPGDTHKSARVSFSPTLCQACLATYFPQQLCMLVPLMQPCRSPATCSRGRRSRGC